MRRKNIKLVFWSVSETEHLLRLRERGYTQKEIASRLGRTYEAVNGRLLWLNKPGNLEKIYATKARQESLPDNIVEGMHAQAEYWRSAEDANEAFLALLREHHPDQEGLVTEPCTERPIPIRNDNHVYISSSMGLV